MTRVWDPLLRVLHWMLVAGVVAGWVTTVALGGWHETLGYVAAGAAVARVAWGFAGPRHARFASFLRGPRATARYAAEVVAGRERRHLGHNPLGGWMAVALLGAVVGLALSGWLYRTERFWGDETVERVHVALAWLVVGLGALHVGGVVLESLRHGENLVRAMVDGQKRDASPNDVA